MSTQRQTKLANIKQHKNQSIGWKLVKVRELKAETTRMGKAIENISLIQKGNKNERTLS